MKKTVVLLLLFAALVVVFLSVRRSEPTLHIFTWADFVNPLVIREFEREHGVRVRVDTFASNSAMFAKLRLGGGGYDLVTPTDYYAEILEAAELLQPIDHERYNWVEGVDPGYLENLAADPEFRMQVPYVYGTIGLAYRVDLAEEVSPTWRMLGDERFSGRISLLDGARATLGAALLSLGYSLNTTEPEQILEAVAVVRGWRANAAAMDNELFQYGLSSGEFILSMGFSGDIQRLSSEMGHVQYLLPAEGFPVVSDVWVIPADAPNPDLAYKFLEYLRRPEVIRRTEAFTRYRTPYEADLEHRAPEVPAGGEVIRFLGDYENLYTEAWELTRQ